MTPIRRALAALLALPIMAGCSEAPEPTPRVACPTEAPTSTSAQAILADAALATVTVSGAAEGSFTIELLPDAAPIAAANFVALARCGFYDGLTFHRVIAGFVIQAGDPQTRSNRGDGPEIGRGGPGYGFTIEPPPDDIGFDPYVVAMANDTVENGSQFFVTLTDLDRQLRSVGAYSIFGRVSDGTGVVDAIAAVPVGSTQGVPIDPVIIESIVISAATPEPSG